MCYHHTAVEVKPSNMRSAGRGLFAKKAIQRHQYIADYTVGTEKLSKAEFEAKRRAGQATHIALIRGDYYDASDAQRSVAGMANRASTGGRNNLKLTSTGRIRATRNIPAGTELLLSYGNAYRL